jgi:hypothetical protein
MDLMDRALFDPYEGLPDLMCVVLIPDLAHCT